MITFRQKNIIKNLIPEALEYLKSNGIRPNLISEQEAPEVSAVNSKSMVLLSFIENENGFYQIKIQDKALYNYTQKLIKDIFRMRILDINKEERTIVAETNHKGIALDIIEVLGRKYNLSIVTE